MTIIESYTLSFFLSLDGSNMYTLKGDGSDMGNCPSHHSGYRCLSTGSCNVCGLIAGKAEGCNVFSTASVCDADSTTSGYQSVYLDSKEGECIQCKNKGMYNQYLKIFHLITNKHNYL